MTKDDSEEVKRTINARLKEAVDKVHDEKAKPIGVPVDAQGKATVIEKVKKEGDELIDKVAEDPIDGSLEKSILELSNAWRKKLKDKLVGLFSKKSGSKEEEADGEEKAIEERVEEAAEEEEEEAAEEEEEEEEEEALEEAAGEGKEDGKEKADDVIQQ